MTRGRSQSKGSIARPTGAVDLKVSETPGIEARVGARWWADKIRQDFFPDAGAQPGDAVAEPMAVGLIGLLHEQERRSLSVDKIDAYETALARRIQAMLDEGESSYGTAMELGCDYGPGPAHAAALRDAGINPGRTTLPWKTVMWVQPGSVKVGDGYGAEPAELPLEGGQPEVSGPLGPASPIP